MRSDGGGTPIPKQLLSFPLGPNGGDRFNVRAAGIAVRPADGAVLFHKVTGRDYYWSLPGGRCDLGENAAVTVAREMREEAGVEAAQVGPLVCLAETFFHFLGVRYHELGFYFRVDFPQDTWIYEHSEAFAGDEAGMHLTFAWLKPDDPAVRSLLFPTFLPDLLTALPDAPRHIVHIERDGVPDGPPRSASAG
jgi:NTP pyrophosphohydrolases including oxidative damage repair enzymes